METKDKNENFDEASCLDTYLEGLKRYQNKGVRILVDGIECGESGWERIFEFKEDGGFYMGDFVREEQGVLREIRFEKTYRPFIPSQTAI